jgi:glucokinase
VSREPVLAFDLGGTRLKAGVVLYDAGRGARESAAETGSHGGGRRTGSDTARVEGFVVTESAPDADRALGIVEKIGRKLLDEHRCKAVGLCVPGLVGDDGRIIALPGKLAGIVGRDLAGWLCERFNVGRSDVVVVNDAIAFAAGEASHGAARGHGRAVVVTIGTGVGVAVTENGAPIGSGPLGGGLLGGQIPIADDPTGPTDTNGKHGTIEALCAARRIVDYANAAGASFATVREVYAAADDGDDAACSGLDRYRRHLCRALVALAHAHAPSVIVLGGGPMAAGNPVLSGLQAMVDAELWPGYAVALVPAALGDDAALLGLAHLLDVARPARR